MAPSQVLPCIIQRPLAVLLDEHTNPESTYPLPFPTSTAPGTETCYNRGRNRNRAQEAQEPEELQELQEPPRYVLAQPHQDEERCNPIPILSTNHTNVVRGQKRQHSSLPEINDPYPSKRPQLAPVIHTSATRQDYDPIGYWAENQVWPKDYIQRGAVISVTIPKKRKAESAHRSNRLERLAENGVFINSSSLIQKSSKDLCRDLIKGDRQPTQYCPFPPEQLSNVLQYVYCLNKGRIQRDVTPWVVPSAELLFFGGELDVHNIGDEVNAEWIRCATMGSTRPKPDYTAGLLPSAFTKDELQKLRNYASPSTPVFFTPNLCFPFLICEVKTGEQGLNQADRQNIHSASIAVRGVLELFKAAFGNNSERVRDLYGQVLVFTVSHDHDKVSLYGHYAAVSEANKLQYYRHQIALISLSINDGADRFVAYNFVRNVYDKFAPAHLRRIQDASGLLPRVPERTNLSFSALALEDAQSHSNSRDTESQDDSGFQIPGLPASTLNSLEVIRLKGELERQVEENKKRIERQEEENKKRIERQEEEHKKQKERQRLEIKALWEEIEQIKEQRAASTVNKVDTAVEGRH